MLRRRTADLSVESHPHRITPMAPQPAIALTSSSPPAQVLVRGGLCRLPPAVTHTGTRSPWDSPGRAEIRPWRSAPALLTQLASTGTSPASTSPRESYLGCV